ncbi:MAG: S-layer homology domain-containing protein, partial [Clostridia bacterium]
SFGKNNDGKTADGNYYMGCWVPITPEYLENALTNGKVLKWTYKFDWNGDNTVDQTFNITVDPADITLNKDGDVWCQTVDGKFTVRNGGSIDGTIEKITEVGTVDGSNITVAGATLDWFAKDTSIGRYQDGWWVGVKIVAPAFITEDNVDKVTYSSDGTDELAKSFGKNNDGKTADGNYYMGCWVPITPEYLEGALDADSVLKWTYKFDWTGNGTVDQTFTITVDPADITLNKDGDVWCQTVDGVMVIKDGAPVHSHSYGTEWFSDSTNHWKECSCGEKAEEAAHISDGGKVTTEATEETEGVRTYSCTVCGYVIKTESIPAIGYAISVPTTVNNGTLTVSQKTATVGSSVTITVKPNEGYELGQLTVTDSNNNALTLTDNENGSFAFTMPASNVTIEVSFHAHSFGTEWVSNSTNHWKECSCGKKAEEAAHISDGGKVTTAATEGAEGIRTYSCTVCGYIIKTETIPAIGYKISAPTTVNNGTLTVSQNTATVGSSVTITVKPNEGYELGQLTVSDSKGNALTLTDNGNGSFTFTMPASNVTIEVKFNKIKVPVPDFVDVPADAYYADAVEWAASLEITNGTSDNTFSPDDSCTRAQMVTFLWRASGCPVIKGSIPFNDVAENAYYTEAVRWAVNEGITQGTSDTTFSPDDTVNRAQAVTFLYRNAGAPSNSASIPFADVSGDAYYANAVLWAVSEGITYGTSTTTFSPDNNCTRAQNVTFLYRALAE